MQHFKNLITKIDKNARHDLYRWVKECRVFVFDRVKEQRIIGSNDIEYGFDAPFPIFSIENKEYRPLFDCYSTADRACSVFCLAVRELGPKNYEFCGLANPLEITARGRIFDDDKPLLIFPTPGDTRFAAVVEYYLDLIKNRQSGIERVNSKIKVKSVDSGTLRVKDVIHIGDPKTYGPSLTTREIDWTHRFEVRGHWRKFDGLGKDRQGIRQVEGFTWISDYVKGDERLPVIKKVRMV